MKTLTKWLVGIVIGLIIIASGIFVWQKLKPVKTISAPTSTMDAAVSIADWKTYTNVDYGFSFKYPTNLNIKENYNNTNQSVKLVIVDQNVSIIVFKGKMSLADLKNQSEARGNVILNSREIAGNIKGAISEKYYLGGISSGKEIVATNNIYAVSAELYTNPGSNTMSSATFDQILSTFEFKE